MNKSKIIVFSLLAFLLLFSKNVLADTYISSCQELNQSGETYYLTQDIINSGISKCIEITANNIVFDCQGHTIDGDDIAEYGIYIYRSSNQVTNITLRNCNVTDWDTANIYLEHVDNNTLENIISLSSPDSGIYLYYSHNNSFINITTSSNNANGFYVFRSSSNTFTNIITNNNNGYGISCSQAYSNTFTNIITNNNYCGITLSFLSSSIFTNITANNNDYCGIRCYESSTNTFTNIIANDNEYGFYFSSCYSNILNNSIASENLYYDFYVHTSFDSECINYLSNITGSGGKPIEYYYSPINIQDKILSELILCNADNSNVTNVTISGSSTKKNNGIIIIRSSKVNLMNINSSNNYIGIYLRPYSSSNTFTNIIANNNNYGFYFEPSVDSNIVNNSIFQNNTNYGIYLNSAGEFGSNKIFNCFLNNTNNVGFGGSIYSNFWNTTKQLGTRIYSNGNYIGGNYYTNPFGNGYSDTCEDSNYDGFCDSPLLLATNNIDYLPLTFIEQIIINSPQQDKTYISGYLTLSGTVTLESNITYSLDKDANQTICTECTAFNTQFYSPKGEHTVCVYAITTDGLHTDSKCINYTSANTVLQEYPISIVVLLCSLLSLLYYTLRINLIEKPIDLVRFIISLIVLIAVAITLLFGAFNSPLFV